MFSSDHHLLDLPHWEMATLSAPPDHFALVSAERLATAPGETTPTLMKLTPTGGAEQVDPSSDEPKDEGEPFEGPPGYGY
jgi:hypothetical protein